MASGGVQRTVATRSRLVRAMVAFIVVAPFALALNAVARVAPPAVPVLMLVVVLAVGSGFGDRTFWGLDLALRRKFFDAVVSAVPSGDGRVDEIAAARLRRASRHPWFSHALAPVVMVLVAAAPFRAAAEQSAWWLLSLLSPVAMCALTPRMTYLRDARRAYREFELQRDRQPTRPRPRPRV
jgi:hypothetical protein